jgi:hypothetical protein
MAPSSLKQPMEHPLCESRMTEQIPRRLKQDATVIAVIEMSQSSWLVGQSSLGELRQTTQQSEVVGGHQRFGAQLAPLPASSHPHPLITKRISG